MKFHILIKRMLHSYFFLIGAALAIILVCLAVFAPQLCVHQAEKSDLMLRLTAPEGLSNGGFQGYVFGTDPSGRDILARILMGARNSLSIAGTVVACALVIGTLLGIVAGYYGGIADTIIMRLCDVIMSIPQLVFAISFIAVLGESVLILEIVLVMTAWVGYCRQIRNTVLVIRNQEFISASKVLGGKSMHIMLSQILPNCLTPLLVLTSQNFGSVIITESALSFLGMGIRQPAPSWGNMISDGRAYLSTAPWVVMVPGVALMISVLAFNFLGDGLRDVLDPKQR